VRRCVCACRGVAKETRGTAFVIYEDIYDAKNAVEHLSGFNVANRYLIVLYYQPTKMAKKLDNVSHRNIFGCQSLPCPLLCFSSIHDCCDQAPC